MQLEGKVCLLTGASRGMGPLLAERLAKKGAHLALVARSAAQLEQAAADLKRFGVRSSVHAVDLTRLAELPPLVAAIEQALGPVDVLVNNAGVETFQHFELADLDEMARAIELNLTASLALARLVLPGMLARKRGHIVQMASVAGLAGSPNSAVYSGTKAALVMATSCLRQEFMDRGIAFSAICPGFVHGAGMHEIHKAAVGPAPAMTGSTTLDAVAEAVLTAIEKERPLTVVNSLPVRPVSVLQRLFPRLSDRLMVLSVGDYMKRIADSRIPPGDTGGATRVERT